MARTSANMRALCFVHVYCCRSEHWCNGLNFVSTLPGDKVSMLTHIYPHKPLREIEVTICKITRLTAHFMCGLMSDLLICTCL